MRKEGVLLAAVILLAASAFAQAQEGKLGATFDFTYASRYIWRGFDLYHNNDAAIQPSIDVDLYGTGFGFKAFYSTATEDGHVNGDQVNYTPYYGNTAFKGEPYATEYKVGWTYYSYPHNPRASAQEVFGSFSWPNICPLGIVPSYTVVKLWPTLADSDATNAYNKSGWFHIFGLGYDLAVPGMESQKLNLSTNLVYNDGAGAANMTHDWSHIVFGISTGLAITQNLTFTPGFYFQKSLMDNFINDEYWTTLSMAYKF